MQPTKLSITIILLFAFFVSASAQSPYRLNWKKELAILGTGGATFALSGILREQTEPLTETEIQGFDRRDVPGFDRPATFNYSHNARQASDVLLFGSGATPLILFLGKAPRNHFAQISLLYFETLVLTGGLTNLTKRSTRRARPFVYNEGVDLLEKQKNDAQYSFFSGHTSLTTASWFFSAKVFSDFYPESPLKPYVWGAAVTASALTGYFRVAGGKHFASDVIVGFAVGAAVGYMVPHLHKSREDKRMSFFASPNGFYLSYNLN